MRQEWMSAGLLAAAVLAGCGGPPAEPNDESLRDSFAEQIEASSFVADFARNGDEMTFSAPDLEGTPAEWRVVIDTTLVEPQEFDEAMPYVGRVTSDWYANGALVEYLGGMTALPKAVLDRGLGQECWAYWVAAERRWDW